MDRKRQQAFPSTFSYVITAIMLKLDLKIARTLRAAAISNGGGLVRVVGLHQGQRLNDIHTGLLCPYFSLVFSVMEFTLRLLLSLSSSSKQYNIVVRIR